MSKVSSSRHYEAQKITTLYVSLVSKYDYLSLSSNESCYSKLTLWADIYKQKIVIDDWDEVDRELFQFINLQAFESDPDLALDTLFWYRYPTLSSFFTAQRIDIPLCFKKSKSLYGPTMITPQVRLLTMLMRSGRRAYILKNYSTAVQSLSSRLFIKPTEIDLNSYWRFYYRLFTETKFMQRVSSPESLLWAKQGTSDEYYDQYNQRVMSPSFEVRSHLRLQSLLYKEWLKYLPIFSFYVRKVDKMKRKHSRGKSGKYTILWKYVPKYKRFITVLKWFVRDVRFQKASTFHGRLLRSLETLLFDTTSNLVYKFRNFVHSYVFQHHKKTLLKSLRSVS